MSKKNVLTLLCSVALTSLFFSCSSTKVKKAIVFEKTIVAHRGAFKKNNYPQNSIASIKHAIALRCAGSEFDIWLTADDSLVINHDAHYNGLPIEKTDYATLTAKPLSNGEKLPTLRAYTLAGLEGNATTRLVYEIKPSTISKDRGKEVAAKVVNLVREMGARNYAVYISFDYDICKKIKELDPKAHVQYLNGEKSPAELKSDNIDGADYHYSVFKRKPGWIKEAKELGIALNVWTVNDPADMDWVLANEFDFITTDEPELLAERMKLAIAGKGWSLAWSDEFNYAGLPDSSRWGYDTGGNGWGNNELQYYTDADSNNVMVKDGRLTITARKEKRGNNNYTSARLISKGKGDWLYGRIEVNAKLPVGRGVWPAIWMLPTDWKYGGWPESGEIDVMENVGFDPDKIHGSVHTRTFNHVKGTQKTGTTQLSDANQRFHLYAVEWDQSKIDFFVDDNLYFTFKNTGKGFEEWPFDQKFHLLLNIAIGGNWGGQKGVDEALTKAAMEVDFVRVYKKTE